MKVFVTGGGGLVGSHAIERLRAVGHAVRVLVRDNAGRAAAQAMGAEPVFGLVEQAASWDAAKGMDAIVHTAALIQGSWNGLRTVNVEGTRLAAEAAGRHKARLVHISSIAVYPRHAPRTPGAPPIDENVAVRVGEQSDDYGRSKAMAEEAIWTAVKATGASAVALRPCLIYGERDRLFLPKVLAAMRFGLAPMVGEGNNALAMVYAGNVADAVVAALDKPSAQGSFNVANDGRLTQREFFDTVSRSAGRKLRYVRLSPAAASAAGFAWSVASGVMGRSAYPGVPAALKFLAAENPYTSDRAASQLSWKPSTSPVEGLERAMHWLVRDTAPAAA